MKTKSVVLLLFFPPLLLSAQEWQWPLSKRCKALTSEVSQSGNNAILLQPGAVQNPVYGNTFLNYGYFITGTENEPVYAPKTGIVTFETSCVIYPDNVFIQGMTPSAPPEQLAALKRRNPLLIPENCTRGIHIALPDGKKLHMYGFKTLLRHKGEAVKKGERIGTLGFIRTFSLRPCLYLTLSTKEGRPDKHIGRYLLGEDSAPLFDKMIQKQEPYRPERILTATEAEQAWQVFTARLQADHPVFGNPKDAARLRQTETTIYGQFSAQKSLSVHELVLYMDRMLNALHCCHTHLIPADSEYRYPLCPLQLTVHNGRCFTVWDRRGKNEIPTGTEILAVNGISIAELVQRIAQGISTDTVNPAVAQEIAEKRFTAELQRFLPPASEYAFTFKNGSFQKIATCAEKSEQEAVKTEPTVRIPVLTKAQAAAPDCYPLWQREQTKRPPFEILNDTTALIRIKKMNNRLNEETLIDWFQSIAEKHIRYLIIDLRGNDGGGENPTGLLLSFLLSQPFTLSAYSELRMDNSADMYEAAEFVPTMNAKAAISAETSNAASIKLTAYRDVSVKTFTPAERYRFTGTVFVLVDELTVSAGVNAARLLQNAGGIVIGTETRGGYYSCNALQYTHTALPYTGLILQTPIYRQVFTELPSSAIPQGRGLIPDYIVPLTFEDKLYGSDSQRDFCMNMMKNKQSTPPTQEALPRNGGC